MEYGTIIRKSTTEYSWNLGTGLPLHKVLFSSKLFAVSCGKCCITAWFQLRKSSECKFDVFLSICPQGFKLDLHILLRYKKEKKDFSFKSLTHSAYKPLATISVKDLLEITCAFLKVEKLVIEGCESGTQAINNKLNKISVDERKDEKASSEINEPRKLKGLVELSENFKAAFLDDEESDVTFKVGNQKYPAHKVIIKVRSPVFSAMLKHDMREKTEGVINIPDCDPLIFRDFLCYIYTGKLDEISKENVFQLYCISDKYDVKGLKIECVEFILDNLSVDIVCDAISLAVRHCDRTLLSRATGFFTDHAQDILQTVKWQKFVEEYPTEANELFLKTFKKITRR